MKRAYRPFPIAIAACASSLRLVSASRSALPPRFQAAFEPRAPHPASRLTLRTLRRGARGGGPASPQGRDRHLSKRYDKQKRRTRRSFESGEIVELHDGLVGGKFGHETGPWLPFKAPERDAGGVPRRPQRPTRRRSCWAPPAPARPGSPPPTPPISTARGGSVAFILHPPQRSRRPLARLLSRHARGEIRPLGRAGGRDHPRADSAGGRSTSRSRTARSRWCPSR